MKTKSPQNSYIDMEHIIAEASKGGQTLKEAVQRMSFALFTNNLCCKLNWSGVTINDNERAVKRNPATTSATESDFQYEVVRFLRGASDLNGRKKVRQDQKIKQAKKMMPTSSFPMPLNNLVQKMNNIAK
ncbi:uncharacterized protein LOC105846348 [Hydra vulgaris]|uniref:uncharacterized protein LOC105846348 n=1 Tax=Hydra vulgaris TaxID=6087 RepID=UPI0032E9DFD4